MITADVMRMVIFCNYPNLFSFALLIQLYQIARGGHNGIIRFVFQDSFTKCTACVRTYSCLRIYSVLAEPSTALQMWLILEYALCQPVAGAQTDSSFRERSCRYARRAGIAIFCRRRLRRRRSVPLRRL